jgi:hypothetical protein
MERERLPKQVLLWTPQGRRRKGRPRRSWTDGVRVEMRETKNNVMTEDSGKWISEDGVERCKPKNIHTQKIYKGRGPICIFRSEFRDFIQGGPDITCQKNSGSLEGSNKSKKPLFIRSKIMGIN